MMVTRWAFCLGMSVLVLCAVPSYEKNSLIDLHTSTVGASWTNKWNLSADPCGPPAWFGVTCDGSLTTVTSLVMVGNLLKGTLPDLLLPNLSAM